MKIIAGLGNPGSEYAKTMQEKLMDIAENGQSIAVTVGIDETSSRSMSQEVGADGLALSDALEMWVEENAYKGNYHIQGTTDKQMLFDDIRNLKVTEMDELRHLGIKFSILHVDEELPAVKHSQKSVLRKTQLLEWSYYQFRISLCGHHTHIA